VGTLRVRDGTGRLERVGIFPLALRVRLALAGVALAALVGIVARWLLMLVGALHSEAGRYDFSTYYAAAAVLRTDPHANIYAAAVLDHAGATAHVLVNPPLPYTYPPLLALLCTPLTLTSFRVASRLWLLGNTALWLAATLALAVTLRALLGARLAGPDAAPTSGDPAPARLVALARDPAPLVALAVAAWLSLTSWPGTQTLLTGQVNFLVLLPLALVPWLTMRGHERAVGVAIAVAAMLKLTPVLLIVYLVLRRRWRAAAAALVTLAVLAVASALVVGPGVLLAALPQALSVGTHDAALGHNQALFAPLLTLLTVGGSPALTVASLVTRLLTVALALALGALLWRRAPASARVTSLGEPAAYAIALCAMLLLAPAAWVHHYVWTLPAAIIAVGLVSAHVLDDLRGGRGGRALAWLALVLVACVAVGLALPYAWDTQPHPAVTTLGGLPLWPLALEMRPLATLLLVVALVWAWPRTPGSALAQGVETAR
jgi:hypothetical protein